MRKLCAQEEGEGAAIARGERQPPHRDGIEWAVAHFAEHNADSAAVQGFFHCRHQLMPMSGRNDDKPLRRQPEGLEGGAIRHATLGQCHVLGDPDEMLVAAGEGRQPQRKTGGRRQVRFASGGDFVQRAAQKTATEGVVHGAHIQRQHRRTLGEAGRFLQAGELLAQRVEHH